MDIQYTSRPDKAAFVARKYAEFLTGKVLDVGADAGYLRGHIGDTAEYTGIGFGDGVDKVVDLEKEKVPFPDRSFDTVLCLDVLEHLDNIHAVFDDLCRVADRSVIVSLPSPYANLYALWRSGDATQMKFYGLPPEPPEDRHKWFFSYDQAVEFLKARGEKNGYEIVSLETKGGKKGSSLKGAVRNLLEKILFRQPFSDDNVRRGTIWCVLQRKGKKQ